MEKTDLDKFKEIYSKIQKEHKLPEFEKLNEDFQIEKISDCETDFLIREIRKYMTDKFSNYLRFIEVILHPSNAPMFVFSIIKNLSTQDKENLTEIYKQLAKYEVKLIELDIKYNEEKEVKFIKESNKKWQEIKEKILKIFQNIETNWDNKIETNGKNYFG